MTQGFSWFCEGYRRALINGLPPGFTESYGFYKGYSEDIDLALSILDFGLGLKM